ncbi:MAG: hypothetical protein M3Q07_08955, partial [Pseudobdellovibrionaceae bacterium]|nr:hypothetical protein [Pseudobdellovibrionaceae bacterium]
MGDFAWPNILLWLLLRYTFQGSIAFPKLPNLTGQQQEIWWVSLMKRQDAEAGAAMQVITRLLLVLCCLTASATQGRTIEPNFQEYFSQLKDYTVISVSEGQYEGLDISDKLFVFEDKENSLSLETVVNYFFLGKFRKPDGKVPNFGPTSSRIWAILPIQNTFEREIILRLELEHYYASSIVLTHLDQPAVKKRSGLAEKFSERDSGGRDVSFQLNLKPGLNLYAIEATGPYVVQLPIKLWSPHDFLTKSSIIYTLVDMVIGFGAAILVYGFVAFIGSRDKVYSYYCLFVLCNLIYFSLSYSQAHELLFKIFGIDSIPTQVLVLSVFGIIIFAGLFSAYFLELKRSDPNRKILTVIFCMALLGAILTGFSVNYGVATCLVLSSIAANFYLWIGVKKFNVHLYAKVYVIAWSFYLVSSASTVFCLLGLLEPFLLTHHGQLAGSVVEMSLLTIAIGVKIKDLKRDLLKESTDRRHSYKQLQKVFYRHQLNMIREGRDLEETMPRGTAKACVIAFDVQGSSQLGHTQNHDFFEAVLKKCHSCMMSYYDPKALTANAYM